MWLEEIEEIFKGYLPYYLLIFLPIFIIVSPVNPVSASSEFPVYRMQQFDLHGVTHGCKSSGINLEAKSLASWSSTRHCVVTKFRDLTVESYRSIKLKAGALLLMLPDDWKNLTTDDKQYLLSLENSMFANDETYIPVYFADYCPKLEAIISELAYGAPESSHDSAVDALVNSISANGYQIVVSGGSPVVMSDAKITTVHGYLTGYGQQNSKIQTIAIVAHYDSLGIAPELSFGADSNGSGVVILLELVRLFSGLYADHKTRGKFNLVFILTGGGKINYQGSKKWLEDQLDISDGSIIQDASYVMCLDTLAANDSIYMHVSKPPKEGSSASYFYKELKQAADDMKPSVYVDTIHKKINLADDMLGWEHERYSIRRLPAFTVSSLKSHKDLHRTTIFDTAESLDVVRLANHTKIIVEALARQIYNLSAGSVFGKSWDVNHQHIDTWINYLSNQPRSPQLVSEKDNSLVVVLKDTFNKYLREVKVTSVVPDKRDPDFQFYKVFSSTVNVYSVKPAVFDLVLTIAIVLYLVGIYFFVNNFASIYAFTCTLTVNRKMKDN